MCVRRRYSEFSALANRIGSVVKTVPFSAWLNRVQLQRKGGSEMERGLANVKEGSVGGLFSSLTGLATCISGQEDDEEENFYRFG